jgi:YVTN family beta-propeller protein
MILALLLLFANPPATRQPLPGMPPVLNPRDIYSADHANQMSPVVKNFPSFIYVPNSGSSSVDVIDPKTFKIVRHFKVGRQPQHVTPSYDLKTLWVLSDLGDSLTRIDPATGMKHDTVKVKDPYNMYYTPDGKYAIVVAEQLRRLDFREPKTMKLEHSLHVPCPGVDHMDFSADGRYLIASCEFGAKMIKVDVAERKLVGSVTLRPGGMPQDVKLSPDGKVFYVADMHADGVFLIDGVAFKEIGFIATGMGTHGLYPSRDARDLYVANRGSHRTRGHPRGKGSVSVIDFATEKVVATWPIPGGGSPDMGNVSADGKQLWLSGRFDNVVYDIDTATGAVKKIPVGQEPHGLTVWPLPGRYSLGHTGNLR